MSELIQAYYKEMIRLLKKVEKITELADKTNGNHDTTIHADMMVTRTTAQVRIKALQNSIDGKK